MLPKDVGGEFNLTGSFLRILAAATPLPRWCVAAPTAIMPLMARARSKTDGVLKELRDFGLRFPGAHTKSPWPGHLDLAVNDKTFAYLSIEGQPFSISCKLPRSCGAALELPFTKPTGYGLGKSGWVSAEFSAGEEPPVSLLKDWIDESYRAQAPKKLVASLDAPAAEKISVGGRKKRPPTKTSKPPSKAKRPVVRRRAS